MENINQILNVFISTVALTFSSLNCNGSQFTLLTILKPRRESTFVTRVKLNRLQNDTTNTPSYDNNVNPQICTLLWTHIHTSSVPSHHI